ncbi:hypothetical protein CTA1_9758 [Colletotrichum tanaceti]|uniref:Uncharacterized protein n=1 Tax=Colletotrichum tanaceti TaxID=1306861 RepID=A0A4U6XDP1_9PEZI|nr:hypothetical protein CTA1_9758 [Colletotrichum tanaceti]
MRLQQSTLVVSCVRSWWAAVTDDSSSIPTSIGTRSKYQQQHTIAQVGSVLNATSIFKHARFAVSVPLNRQYSLLVFAGVCTYRDTPDHQVRAAETPAAWEQHQGEQQQQQQQR